MNPTLRQVLRAVVVVCGVFMTAWLATAAAQAPPPPAPRLSMELLESHLQPPPSPADPTGPGPRLVATSKAHDFGEVLQGSKAEHVFEFRNQGDREAHIQEVTSSCGCTATVLSTKVVPPGGTARVRAVYSAGGARGRFEKTLRVVSDDPSSPLVLRVAGRVSPLIRVEPELVFFGRVAPGATRRQSVRLAAARPDVVFQPALPKRTTLAVDAEGLRPVPGHPGSWELDLVARPEQPGDVLSGTVLVPTGNGESPYAVLNVAGDVEGAK